MSTPTQDITLQTIISFLEKKEEEILKLRSRVDELEYDIGELEDRVSDAEDEAESESQRANEAEKSIGWQDHQVESMNSARAAELLVEHWVYVSLEDVEDLLKRKGAPI